jgi:isopenicillin N synthase-like dioxygenase
MPIPVIDLRTATATTELLETYGSVGFGYIVGHGIDPALTSAVFDAARRFHALPHDVKMLIELDDRHRGFIPINTSTDRRSSVATVTKPNQSESFMMMREDAIDSPAVRAGRFLAGTNQWPELIGFRDTVERYHVAMVGLSRAIVDRLAVGLGDEDRAMRDAFDPPTTWLRLLRYPPRAADATDDLFGSAPHCDFGCITLLAQDDIGGLQVLGRDGEWIDVAPMEHSLVMNVGDMLHRWSNGRLRSTPHRVINVSGRERYSVPFFYDPSISTVVAPLPSGIDDDHPSQFEPIEFESFLRRELSAGYDRHRPGHEPAREAPTGSS